MLILAGVSINAIVGDNGILTKAQNAKLTSEEATRREELDIILLDYNTSAFLGTEDGIGGYLLELQNQGIISEYLSAGEDVVVQYEDNWYSIIGDDSSYKVGNKLSSPTEGGNGNFIITPDNATNGTVNFEEGGSYLVLDNLNADNFNFYIPAGDPVTIKLMGDMLIDNSEYVGRSAIDLEDGATLNLYVYGNVEVNSSFGLEGGTGSSADDLKGGPGANAGIHVTENSTLNLYGTGTIKCIGGDAGDGGTCPENSYDDGGRRWRRCWSRNWWKWRQRWRY